jgi:hypothetical protein
MASAPRQNRVINLQSRTRGENVSDLNMYMTKVERGDLAGKWALPDRVFFACGACHVLAYAAIQALPQRDFKAIWIKPRPGYTGNHIVAVSGSTAFDYHGFSDRRTLFDHTHRKAARWWPGWDADLIELPADALISEAKSRTYDGLWLRQPDQFLHDALPRAYRFLGRFAVTEVSHRFRRATG